MQGIVITSYSMSYVFTSPWSCCNLTFRSWNYFSAARWCHSLGQHVGHYVNKALSACHSCVSQSAVVCVMIVVCHWGICVCVVNPLAPFLRHHTGGGKKCVVEHYLIMFEVCVWMTFCLDFALTNTKLHVHTPICAFVLQAVCVCVCVSCPSCMCPLSYDSMLNAAWILISS